MNPIMLSNGRTKKIEFQIFSTAEFPEEIAYKIIDNRWEYIKNLKDNPSCPPIIRDAEINIRLM